jgi:hypothetical protein
VLAYGGPSAKESGSAGRIAPELEERIRKALATPGRPGVRVIAAKHGVSVNTVQRIASPFANVDTSVVVV